MAVLTSVLGKFNQTMGDVTFSNWKGRNVAKQRVPRTNTSQSVGQLIQRQKIKGLGYISKLLAPIIRVGFSDAATTTTQFNVFVKTNYPIVDASTDEYSVDWEMVKVSSGPVVGVEGLVVTRNLNTISLKWADNSNGVDALETDVLYFGVLSEDRSNASVRVYAAKRNEGATGYDMPVKNGAAYVNGPVYAFFKRDKNTNCSETAYTQVQ
jgi:hypothetical protein